MRSLALLAPRSTGWRSAAPPAGAGRSARRTPRHSRRRRSPSLQRLVDLGDQLARAVAGPTLQRAIRSRRWRGRRRRTRGYRPRRGWRASHRPRAAGPSATSAASGGNTRVAVDLHETARRQTAGSRAAASPIIRRHSCVVSAGAPDGRGGPVGGGLYRRGGGAAKGRSVKTLRSRSPIAAREGRRSGRESAAPCPRTRSFPPSGRGGTRRFRS
jgi:hypothetical protein